MADKISNKLLTVNEVANILRVSNMTVYRLVKSGQHDGVPAGEERPDTRHPRGQELPHQGERREQVPVQGIVRCEHEP